MTKAHTAEAVIEEGMAGLAAASLLALTLHPLIARTDPAVAH